MLPLLSSTWEWPRHPNSSLYIALTLFPMCINGSIFNTFCDVGLFILCISGNKCDLYGGMDLTNLYTCARQEAWEMIFRSQ